MLLVDECRWLHRGRRWCHLISDTSFAELHAFARQLGIPRVAFQGDHYDLHEDGQHAALVAGAQRVSGSEIVRALNNANLRRGPALRRRGLAGVTHLPAPTIETERLILRQWLPADIEPAVSLMGDEATMKYLGGPRTREETIAEIDEQAVNIALIGFGKWALALRETGDFIGRVGMTRVFHLPIGPALEMGWRLQPQHQGKGFATEAAFACLAYARNELDAFEVVAYTHIENTASRAVMERLKMTRDESNDFELDEGGPHKRTPQVLYRWRPSR